MINFSEEKMKKMSVVELLSEMNKTVNELSESQSRNEKMLAEAEQNVKKLDELLKTL